MTPTARIRACLEPECTRMPVSDDAVIEYADPLGLITVAMNVEAATIAASPPETLGERKMCDFRKDIEETINRHSKESGSNTPDFILAEYLTDCLATFDKAVVAREQWYGRVAEDGVLTGVDPE